MPSATSPGSRSSTRPTSTTARLACVLAGAPRAGAILSSTARPSIWPSPSARKRLPSAKPTDGVAVALKPAHIDRLAGCQLARCRLEAAVVKRSQALGPDRIAGLVQHLKGPVQQCVATDPARAGKARDRQVPRWEASHCPLATLQSDALQDPLLGDPKIVQQCPANVEPLVDMTLVSHRDDQLPQIIGRRRADALARRHEVAPYLPRRNAVAVASAYNPPSPPIAPLPGTRTNNLGKPTVRRIKPQPATHFGRTEAPRSRVRGPPLGASLIDAVLAKPCKLLRPRRKLRSLGLIETETQVDDAFGFPDVHRMSDLIPNVLHRIP